MSLIVAVIFAGQFFLADQSNRALRETRKKVREYADCIVKKRPGDATAAVLSMSENTTLTKDYPKILDEYCFTGFTDKMAFPADLLRYALADALVRRELANQPVLDPQSIAPLAHRDPVPPPSVIQDNAKTSGKKTYNREQWLFGVALAYAQVSHLGECVVRTDPGGANRMLASAPTSDVESAAMRALHPALSGCLAKGNTAYLTKEVLRGTIALNYYRLSKAPRVVSGVAR